MSESKRAADPADKIFARIKAASCHFLVALYQGQLKCVAKLVGSTPFHSNGREADLL
jgi:hypothetical protein